MDLSRLNSAQTEAVLHGDTPLLVLAGAGTGKTTVITYRIAHVMGERGVRPGQILAVTFTNKAAREMRERAGKLAGHDPRTLDIGTFHGMCGRILRRHGHKVGLDPRFVIYDADDQLLLIRRVIEELNLDPQVFAPRVLRHRIEQWKNQGMMPGEVTASPLDLTAQKALDVYHLYERRLIDANAVDFGDMLVHAVRLLRDESDVRTDLQRRWTHILVDEYQDTNRVQYLFLKQLISPSHSLTVVGDDDQSIYRWRGADIGNILRFEKDFPGAALIRLEHNYRSTKNILAAANAVISHNVARKGKTLFTEAETGPRLRLRLFASEHDEGEAVAADIAEVIADGQDLDEVAVLYRTNAQSRAIEDGLRRRRINYAVFGGIRFYDRREIKDALAYLRLLVNPNSPLDFLRVINAPARGIGKVTLEKLNEVASRLGVSLFEAARRVGDGEGGLTKKAASKLAEFSRFMRDLEAAAVSMQPARLLERVLEQSGYLKELRDEGTEEAQERIENLEELAAALDEYSELSDQPSLAGFLEDVALATDVDTMDENAGKVSLMTLHSAKGLEFELVFMPGLEEGIFPHSRSFDERAALEEERRLCYVGITRAKRDLRLSAARMRTVFGRVEWSELSRFVAEIPSDLLDLGPPEGDEEDDDGTPQKSAARPGFRVLRGGKDVSLHDELSQVNDADDEDHLSDDRNADLADDPTTQRLLEPKGEPEGVEARRSASGSGSRGLFDIGSAVRHATFGEGRVVDVSGAGRDQRLTVEFPGLGRKTIVARFLDAL